MEPNERRHYIKICNSELWVWIKNTIIGILMKLKRSCV
jgi:hypothetical protein